MSRTTRALLPLALVLPMSLGASAALAQSPAADPYPLGTEITLTEMAGEAVAPDAGITATFDADGTVSGFGGCNSYSAAWDSDGTTLTIGPITATLMACGPTDALESQYLGLLQGAASWSLDGLAVTVTSSDGSTLVYGSDSEGPAIVGEWLLSTFGGTPVPSGITATAIFGADGSLTGSGGCNTYSGTYTVDGASLSISRLAATRMFCESTGEIEPALLDTLEAATGWSVDGGRLTIESTVPLVLTNGTEPAGTLTGQAWFLVSQGGVAVDPALGISATFADDGSVSGSGGCNGYSSNYTVDGDSISIRPVLATRMACGPDADAAEAAYFGALEGAASFALSGSGLVITTADGGTLEFSAGSAPAPSVEPSAEPGSSTEPGSSAEPGSSVAPAGNIVGTWQMTEIAGQALPGGLLDIDLTFADDGTLSGNGGCNDYTGEWSLSGTTIALTNLVIGTGGTCNATTQSLEQSFWSLLPFVDVAEVTDSGLSLVASLAGNVGFEFSAGSAPAPSVEPSAEPGSSTEPGSSAEPGSSVAPAGNIVGTWQMTEIAGQALPGGLLDIDLTFADDGTLSGNGGCNDYTGEWSLSGTTIALTNLVIGTGGTCNATTQSLEQSFWSLLPFVDVAEVTDSGLSLVASLAGNVGFKFAPAD